MFYEDRVGKPHDFVVGLVFPQHFLQLLVVGFDFFIALGADCGLFFCGNFAQLFVGGVAAFFKNRVDFALHLLCGGVFFGGEVEVALLLKGLARLHVLGDFRNLRDGFERVYLDFKLPRLFIVYIACV